jgi:hypothetical protein
MPTATVSIAEFVAVNRITMTAQRVSANPNMQSDTRMDHWKVQFSMGRKRMTAYFSMGLGHNGRMPEAEDVLDCLASDSASVDNARGFEDWASDFGYDTDSRTAEKTFKACEHAATRLSNFLGSGLYAQLLWNTERL